MRIIVYIFEKKLTKNVNIKFTKCQNYNGEHSITK